MIRCHNVLQYLLLVKGGRNDESHISPTASEQEVNAAIRIIRTTLE